RLVDSRLEPTMNPSQKQREQSIENDNRQNKVIEKVEPAQINQRPLNDTE
ncbi:unnamed protein product, partial [Rotaria sp. Silwood1]